MITIIMPIDLCYAASIIFFFFFFFFLSSSRLKHSHKKRKDSLETRAKPAVFSL